MTEKQKQPSWLMPMIDQRLAKMYEHMGEEGFAAAASNQVMIMTFLTEPSENASKTEQSYWERSCDNCGRYVKEGDKDITFHTGHKKLMFHGAVVTITFGACSLCVEEAQ